MKKTALISASLLFALTSCMKDTGYEASFTLVDDGNYDNAAEIFKDGATYFLFGEPEEGDLSAFISKGTTVYYSKVSSGSLLGGFALSRQHWTEPETDEGEDQEGEETESGTGEDTGSETQVPGEYSVYGKSSGTTANTFFYFRQTGNMPEHDITFASADAGTCTPSIIQVCNSAAAVRKIMGDDVSTFNLKGDYTLKVTGYLNGAKTKEATFLLAGKGKSKRPESENPQRDSIVTSWRTLDLSGLGNIDTIDFDLVFSEEEDKTLMQDATDVCLDNFTASIFLKF